MQSLSQSLIRAEQGQETFIDSRDTFFCLLLMYTEGSHTVIDYTHVSGVRLNQDNLSDLITLTVEV